MMGSDSEALSKAAKNVTSNRATFKAGTLDLDKVQNIHGRMPNYTKKENQPPSIYNNQANKQYNSGN